VPAGKLIEDIFNALLPNAMVEQFFLGPQGLRDTGTAETCQLFPHTFCTLPSMPLSLDRSAILAVRSRKMLQLMIEL
jgi:hypothetical protein